MAEYTKESFVALEAALTKAMIKHEEAQRQIGVATDGDTNVWHDNSAFDEANREEQRWRIEVGKLKRLVADAVVVEKTDVHDHVQVGTRVTLLIDGNEETFVIAGEQNLARWSEDGTMQLSQSSPLGAALMGHVAGNIVYYTVPNGSRQEAKIINLQ